MSYSVLDMHSFFSKDKYSEYVECERTRKQQRDWQLTLSEREINWEPPKNSADWKDIIRTYLNLDNKIDLIKLRRSMIRKRFKEYNWIHSPMAYDEAGIRWMNYPSFDTIINEYVDSIAATDSILEAIEFKKNQFSKFLNKLNGQQRYLLENGLDDRLNTAAVEFIKNVESQMPRKYRF